MDKFIIELKDALSATLAWVGAYIEYKLPQPEIVLPPLSSLRQLAHSDSQHMDNKAMAETLHAATLLCLEWIDATPDNNPMPVMPGFDRDWMDDVLGRAAELMPYIDHLTPDALYNAMARALWNAQSDAINTGRQPDGPEFTIDDPDLDLLLNLASDLVKGLGNMDTGMLFSQTLERIQARLKSPQLPEEPDQALLISMATCLNHGFGMDSKQSQDMALYDMRKLYDEVAGRGYYKPEVAGRYTAMLNDESYVAPIDRLGKFFGSGKPNSATSEDFCEAYGVKADGTTVRLPDMPMPPNMKAREIVRSYFGGDLDEDGSLSNMTLECCKELVKWMRETAMLTEDAISTKVRTLVTRYVGGDVDNEDGEAGMACACCEELVRWMQKQDNASKGAINE